MDIDNRPITSKRSGRRIVLLLTDLEIGGTPTVVRELAIRLHRAGWHVEVVGLSKAGPLMGQLFSAGVKCTALGARGTWDFKIAWGLWRLLRQERIDTVFSFLVHANALAAVMRVLYPQARYLQSIQTTQARPRWHWGVQRWVGRAAEWVVVPSPSVAIAARRWAGVEASRIEVVENAIEMSDFGAQPVRADRAVSRVGFIGRLDPVKRIGDLIEAVGLMATGVELDIFGEGSERARLEELIRKLGLGARVRLRGRVDRPHEGLAEMDVLVLPSEAEGFGLVLIEAMAAGVPVVATRAPGIVDVVTDGETGLLVPVGSPQALAGAIGRLIEDSSLRMRLVECAKREVAARFSWGRVLERYLEIL